MIIAYTIPAVFISFMLTGNPIPQLGLGSEMADGTYLLDKLDQVVKKCHTNALHLTNNISY
jgi:cation/acetate symporter